MSIAAVGMIYNEADIISMNIEHLFANGINKMYLAIADSPDGSWGVIENMPYEIEMFHDTDEVWHQAAQTNKLIERAGSEGHEWILPFDADEFVYATDRSLTIAEALASCPHEKIYLHQWSHHTWEKREVEYRRLPKVAFRYSPGVTVSMGAHECTLPGGEWDVLDIRELTYRSFDHFCRKAKERIATLDPVERANGNGWHMTRLDGKTDEEMRVEWEIIQSAMTVVDPIPVRTYPGFDLHGLDR